MGKLDFEGVATAALDQALTLLPSWMGGKKEGRNWVGEKRANGGPGDSWSISLDTGIWAHFGGDETGSDMTSLYAALHGISQGDAYHAVSALVGLNGSERPLPAPKRERRAAEPEYPPDAIPDDAPDLTRRPDFIGATVYRYGSAFAVVRTPDKSFHQFTWRRGKWWGKAFPAPRPMYNVADLLTRTDKAVLIVEGEKCVEAARDILSSYVIVTWAGGSNAWDKTDWKPLAGRNVLLWPDADTPGRDAMSALAEQLAGSALSIRAIVTEGETGFDIANGILDLDWTGADIKRYANEHMRSTVAPSAAIAPGVTTPSQPAAASDTLPPPAPAVPTTPTISSPVSEAPATAAPATEYLPAAERTFDPDYPDGQQPRSAIIEWKDIGLTVDNKDVPHPTLANASAIMRFHPKFEGKIWYDSFCERIYHTLYGDTPREWDDIDSKRATAFIQSQLNLPRISLKIVEDAVIHAAHERPVNSVKQWLESIEWDKEERLSTWVGDCLGVELTPYSMAVGRNWLISMVARVYRPGCQVDTMPVLEGMQGEGKSKTIEILGDRWFAAVSTAFGSFEFIDTIQGKWLIEIPDMAGFGKREHGQVISAITTRSDRYRAKYGRFDKDHPRKCVFAATSETDDYLAEMRGFRRYWPLRCKGIDQDTLIDQRPQLFAEAAAAFHAKEPWHLMPAEDTAAEQMARNNDDPWTMDVLSYVESRALAGHPVHPVTILLDSKIEYPRKELNQAVKLRVITILKANGWHHKKIDNQHMYVKPKRKEQT
jgi:putative DNA primase/helicase